MTQVIAVLDGGVGGGWGGASLRSFELTRCWEGLEPVHQTPGRWVGAPPPPGGRPGPVGADEVKTSCCHWGNIPGSS